MSEHNYTQGKGEEYSREELIEQLAQLQEELSVLKNSAVAQALERLPLAAICFDLDGVITATNTLFNTLPVWATTTAPRKLTDIFESGHTQLVHNKVTTGFDGPCFIGNLLIGNAYFEVQLVHIHPRAYGLTFYDISSIREIRSQNDAIFNRLPDGISIMDKSTEVILQVNEQFANMLGCKPEDLIGQHVAVLHPVEFNVDLAVRLNRVKQHDHIVIEEVPMLHKDGSVFYCDIVNVEVTYNNTPAIYGFFRDISEKLDINTQLKSVAQEAKAKELVLKEAQKVGSIGHWEFFVDSDTLIWSDETYAILGKPKTEAILSFQDYAQLIHPDDKEGFQNAYQDHLKFKKPYDHIHRIVTDDGEIKWVRNSCATIFHINGKPNYSIGAIADITSLKEAEVNLQYERDYSRAIVHSLPDLLFIIGFDGVFRDVKSNPALHKEINRDDFVGKHIGETVPHEFAQRVITTLAEVKSGHSINTMHFNWLEEDQSEKFFSAKFTPFGTDALMCLVRDITQEHNSQIQLLERERELQFLYENMAQGVVYQDAQGFITNANKAAEEILGLSLSQMQGKTSIDPDWYAIKEDGSPFPGEEHPAMVALKTGKPVYNVEMGVHHPGKMEHSWILVSAIPEFGSDPTQPIRVFATFTNISELKRYEQEVEKSKELLEQAGQIAEVGVFDFNIVSNELYWSTALRKIFEVPDDFIPTWDNAFTFFSGEYLTNLEQASQKTISFGDPFDLEVKFKTLSGKIKWARVLGKAIFDRELPVRFFGSFQDITQQRQTFEALKRQSELQDLLIEVSNTYIHLLLEQLDCNLQRSMEQLGKFVNADRFYIFDYDWNKITATNTHEWCAPGIEPQLEYLKDIPIDEMEDWTMNHKAGRKLAILDVLALPEDSYTRSILEPQGIKSIFTVPLMEGQNCIGFIGLDFVKNHYNFSEVEERLLVVFADLLSNLRLRFKTQSELKERRELLADVIEKSQSVIYQKDINGAYTMVNHSFQVATGLARKDILHKTDFELFPEDIARTLWENDQRVLQSMNHLLIDEVITGSAGLKYFQSSKFPVRDANGLVVGIAGMSVDLTQRKLAELELRKSEERFKILFEEATAPMLLIDLNTKQIIDTNRAAQMLYGYPREEFLTKSLFDTNTSVRFVYQKVADLKTQKRVKGETIHKRKNGSTIEVETFASVLNIGGKLVVHEIVEDISERKRYMKTIEKQNEIFRDIAWTQSHIVRAPLARLMGLVEILKVEDFDLMPIQELIVEINNSALELDAVIGEISEKTYLAEKLLEQFKN